MQLTVLGHSALAAAHPARFNNLVHPIHQRGRVFAWELQSD
jgi:hypothetical protein